LRCVAFSDLVGLKDGRVKMVHRLVVVCVVSCCYFWSYFALCTQTFASAGSQQKAEQRRFASTVSKEAQYTSNKSYLCIHMISMVESNSSQSQNTFDISVNR
jgi:hypothetical protein